MRRFCPVHQARGRFLPDQERPLLASGTGRPENGAMGPTAVDVVVTGHVQGVFFRASLRDEAERRGVSGWARNEGDGSVHARLEGEAQAVEELVAWCAEGPPAARVTDVRREPAEPSGATAFVTG